MLPSLHNKLIVTLDPAHITIFQRRLGWRNEACKVDVIAMNAAEAVAAWQAPVSALHNWLKQHQLRLSRVDYIISDRFVRYLVLPWSDALRNKAEINAFARIQFETYFGESPDHWSIKSDFEGYGEAGISCAVPKDLLQALSTFEEKKIRVSSIQPRWIYVFKGMRGRIPKRDNALLMSLEPGQCVLATLKNGVWQSIRTVKLDTSPDCLQMTFDAVVGRELLLQGLEPDVPIYLHAIEIDEAVLQLLNKNDRVKAVTSIPRTMNEKTEVSLGGGDLSNA